MNSEHLKASEGGLTPRRRFSYPAKEHQLDILKSVYIQGGKIYCRMGKEQFLCVIDESTLTLEKKQSFEGIAVAYVGDNEILFQAKGKPGIVLDKNLFDQKMQEVSIPDTLILVNKRNENELLFSSLPFAIGLYKWPSMQCLWSHSLVDAPDKCRFASNGYVYAIHMRGYRKIDLATGNTVFEKASNDWLSHPFFAGKNLKELEVKSEATGIFADTLLLVLNHGTVGIDVNTGEVRWALDVGGRQKIRVTEDGIAWLVKTDEIIRIDMASGTLLPKLPIQYEPVLKKDPSANTGGFDLSETHVIAEVAGRTKQGMQTHVVGIHRDTGVVEWAVPIQGMLMSLFLLNNRIYASGTMMTPDNLKNPAAQTLVIEGEGGYIPD